MENKPILLVEYDVVEAAHIAADVVVIVVTPCPVEVVVLQQILWAGTSSST
jgi:cellulose biosynthesis protein BcsQ